MLITFHDYLQEKHKEKSHKERQKIIKRAKQKTAKFIIRFTEPTNISDSYVKKACSDKNSKVLIYSIAGENYAIKSQTQTQTQKQSASISTYTSNDYDEQSDTPASHCDWENIAGIIMYKRISHTNKTMRMYVQIICLRPESQNYGYGTMILDELINFFMTKRKCISTILEIVVLSLKESNRFYEKYGFEVTKSLYIDRNENYDSETPMIYRVEPDCMSINELQENNPVH